MGVYMYVCMYLYVWVYVCTYIRIVVLNKENQIRLGSQIIVNMFQKKQSLLTKNGDNPYKIKICFITIKNLFISMSMTQYRKYTTKCTDLISYQLTKNLLCINLCTQIKKDDYRIYMMFLKIKSIKTSSEYKFIFES